MALAEPANGKQRRAWLKAYLKQVDPAKYGDAALTSLFAEVENGLCSDLFERKQKITVDQFLHRVDAGVWGLAFSGRNPSPKWPLLEFYPRSASIVRDGVSPILQAHYNKMERPAATPSDPAVAGAGIARPAVAPRPVAAVNVSVQGLGDQLSKLILDPELGTKSADEPTTVPSASPFVDLQTRRSGFPPLVEQPPTPGLSGQGLAKVEALLAWEEASLWESIVKHTSIDMASTMEPIAGPCEIRLPRGLDVFSTLGDADVARAFREYALADITYKLRDDGQDRFVRVLIDRAYDRKRALPFVLASLRQIWAVFVGWATEAYSGRGIAIDQWLETDVCRRVILEGKVCDLHSDLIKAALSQ